MANDITARAHANNAENFRLLYSDHSNWLHICDLMRAVDRKQDNHLEGPNNTFSIDLINVFKLQMVRMCDWVHSVHYNIKWKATYMLLTRKLFVSKIFDTMGMALVSKCMDSNQT